MRAFFWSLLCVGNGIVYVHRQAKETGSSTKKIQINVISEYTLEGSVREYEYVIKLNTIDILSVQWARAYLDAFYIHQNFLKKVLTSPQHGQIPNRDIERKGNKGFRSYQLVGKEVNSYGEIFFLERMDGQTSV